MQFKSFLYSLQAEALKDPNLQAAFQYVILRVMMVISGHVHQNAIEHLESFLEECAILRAKEIYTEAQYLFMTKLLDVIINYMECIEEQDIPQFQRLIIKIYNNEKKAVQEKESI